MADRPPTTCMGSTRQARQQQQRSWQWTRTGPRVRSKMSVAIATESARPLLVQLLPPSVPFLHNHHHCCRRHRCCRRHCSHGPPLPTVARREPSRASGARAGGARSTNRAPAAASSPSSSEDGRVGGRSHQPGRSKSTEKSAFLREAGSSIKGCWRRGHRDHLQYPSMPPRHAYNAPINNRRQEGSLS